jgi:hypothetical protein
MLRCRLEYSCKIGEINENTLSSENSSTFLITSKALASPLKKKRAITLLVSGFTFTGLRSMYSLMIQGVLLMYVFMQTTI